MREPQSEHDLLQDVLDAIQLNLAIIDGRGVILRVNSAWRRFAAANCATGNTVMGVGRNCLEILRHAALQDPTASEALAGIEAVLRGALKTFSLECRCDSSSEDRWHRMLASPLKTAGGGAVIAHYDISDLKQAQQKERQLLARLETKALLLEQQKALLERECSLMERIAGAPPSEVTAKVLGEAPLRDRSPELFKDLLDYYAKLLDVALEAKTYQVRQDLTEAIVELADQVGFLQGTPQDVVDIHTCALKQRLSQAGPHKANAYIEEGRMLVLELMGYLAVHYRLYAAGSG